MESCEGALRPRADTALVSASFGMDIVQEMSGWADPMRTVAIYRQAVPIQRAVMTYLETAAMNHRYREAEAVLQEAEITSVDVAIIIEVCAAIIPGIPT